jgi:cytochrome c553
MQTCRFALAAILAALSFPSTSISQEDGTARSLAATCANCHGTDGRSVTKEVVPLAGLPKEHIVTQMKAFKDVPTSKSI